MEDRIIFADMVGIGTRVRYIGSVKYSPNYDRNVRFGTIIHISPKLKRITVLFDEGIKMTFDRYGVRWGAPLPLDIESIRIV